MISFKDFLTEISSNKAHRYMYKAAMDRSELNNQRTYLNILNKMTGGSLNHKIEKLDKKIDNRSKSMQLSIHKRMGTAKVETKD